MNGAAFLGRDLGHIVEANGGRLDHTVVDTFDPDGQSEPVMYSNLPTSRINRLEGLFSEVDGEVFQNPTRGPFLIAQSGNPGSYQRVIAVTLRGFPVQPPENYTFSETNRGFSVQLPAERKKVPTDAGRGSEQIDYAGIFQEYYRLIEESGAEFHAEVPPLLVFL